MTVKYLLIFCEGYTEINDTEKLREIRSKVGKILFNDKEATNKTVMHFNFYSNEIAKSAYKKIYIKIVKNAVI